MRLTAAEKAEVVRLVEGSDLSVRRMLAELGRATFYARYRRYAEDGVAGLVAQKPAARRYWNRIPPAVRERVVSAALADPERSPRELAWQLTDRTGHFLSESSVYEAERKAWTHARNGCFTSHFWLGRSQMEAVPVRLTRRRSAQRTVVLITCSVLEE